MDSLGNPDVIRHTAEAILRQYGWYLLFLTVCVVLLVDYILRKRDSWEDMTPQAVVVRRQEAVDTSRRRQQEELEANMATSGNMDDVEIIDVNDDGEEMPAAREPSGLSGTESVRLAAEVLLGQYGWYLLLLAVCVVLLVQYVSKRSGGGGGGGVSAQTLVVRRQEALEASRRRQQEELDAKAAEFKEKQKKNIEIWESIREGKSCKTKVSSQAEAEAGSASTGPKPKSSKKLRGSDYNPLTGDAGPACSWRPGRRGPSSGG
ncbi:unnamed protein product [Merluccius merluccius]